MAAKPAAVCSRELLCRRRTVATPSCARSPARRPVRRLPPARHTARATRHAQARGRRINAPCQAIARGAHRTPPARTHGAPPPPPHASGVIHSAPSETRQWKASSRAVGVDRCADASPHARAGPGPHTPPPPLLCSTPMMLAVQQRAPQASDSASGSGRPRHPRRGVGSTAPAAARPPCPPRHDSPPRETYAVWEQQQKLPSVAARTPRGARVKKKEKKGKQIVSVRRGNQSIRKQSDVAINQSSSESGLSKQRGCSQDVRRLSSLWATTGSKEKDILI